MWAAVLTSLSLEVRLELLDENPLSTGGSCSDGLWYIGPCPSRKPVDLREGRGGGPPATVRSESDAESSQNGSSGPVEELEDVLSKDDVLADAW